MEINDVGMPVQVQFSQKQRLAAALKEAAIGLILRGSKA